MREPATAVLSPSPVLYRAGEAFPAVLTLREVAAILGVSDSRARHLQSAGELQQYETASRIGDRIRYSGAKLQQWAEGSAPAFEATGHRHWGGKHR